MKESVIRDISIESPDGLIEKVAGEQVSVDSYMLLENPIFSCRINYGTIVNALPNDKGELIFVRIVKASNYKTRRFLLNSYAKDIDFSRRIGEPIIAAGGTWEVAMGGIAFIHILKESSFDLDLLFKEHDFNPAEITEDGG
jgi:hypothetical protein